MHYSLPNLNHRVLACDDMERREVVAEHVALEIPLVHASAVEINGTVV